MSKVLKNTLRITVATLCISAMSCFIYADTAKGEVFDSESGTFYMDFTCENGVAHSSIESDSANWKTKVNIAAQSHKEWAPTDTINIGYYGNIAENEGEVEIAFNTNDYVVDMIEARQQYMSYSSNGDQGGTRMYYINCGEE